MLAIPGEQPFGIHNQTLNTVLISPFLLQKLLSIVRTEVELCFYCPVRHKITTKNIDQQQQSSHFQTSFLYNTCTCTYISWSVMVYLFCLLPNSFFSVDKKFTDFGWPLLWAWYTWNTWHISWWSVTMVTVYLFSLFSEQQSSSMLVGGRWFTWIILTNNNRRCTLKLEISLQMSYFLMISYGLFICVYCQIVHFSKIKSSSILVGGHDTPEILTNNNRRCTSKLEISLHDIFHDIYFVYCQIVYLMNKKSSSILVGGHDTPDFVNPQFVVRWWIQ